MTGSRTIPFCNCSNLGRVLLVGVGVVVTAAVADEPTSTELMTQLANHHVVPEYLCVAGVTPAQTDDVLLHAASVIETNWDDWSSAESRLETAMSALSTAMAQAANSDATADDQAALVAAQAEFDAASTAKQAEYDQIAASIRTCMSGDVATAFVTVVSNQNRGVPLEYLGLTLTDQDWLDLRSALGEVKTVEEPSTEATQAVSGYDGQYTVSLAKVRIDSHMSQVQSVFMTTLMAMD